MRQSVPCGLGIWGLRQAWGVGSARDVGRAAGNLRMVQSLAQGAVRGVQAIRLPPLGTKGQKRRDRRSPAQRPSASRRAMSSKDGARQRCRRPWLLLEARTLPSGEKLVALNMDPCPGSVSNS